ncbi:hypothetical protein LNGFDJGK_00732 [Enterobacter hormaechei]|nr:hypothetical protein LNGFDJGK_00732 [Enterobacter hormaechei]
MNTEQLMTFCQRHHALLLASDTEMISIAVVGNPASELMEALRFATQKRIDIECWTAERMEKGFSPSHHHTCRASRQTQPLTCSVQPCSRQ